MSLPAPQHAFGHYWGDPACCRIHTFFNRRTLLRLTCGTGVVPNMEVALQASGLVLCPADLAAAADGGHLPAVQWLRSRGCPWDATALEAAAAAGHSELVGWLVEAGCLLTSSVLEAAVREGRIDMAEQLMALGCPISPEVCGAAARRGLYDFVELLCERATLRHGAQWLLEDVGGQLLTGAAEGCSLAELQALYGRMCRACAACYGASISPEAVVRIMQIFCVRTGELLTAAAVRSRTPDWQAKTMWLVEDKEFPTHRGAGAWGRA